VGEARPRPAEGMVRAIVSSRPIWNEGCPDRVSADLRRHESEPYEELTPADFSREDHVSSVVPYELVEPIAAIFQARDEILRIKRSFGIDAVNHQKALEDLMERLTRLESGLNTRWEEL
jgi:hypothetical protein